MISLFWYSTSARQRRKKHRRCGECRGRAYRRASFPVVDRPTDSSARTCCISTDVGNKVVVEVEVVGREIECAVLEGRTDEPERVSVAGEIIVTGREFYDFEAKYLDSDAAKLICPAEISDQELKQMQLLAKKAFRALGCQGLARVDFFLTKDGFVLNEINTMPGFTSISMFPRCFSESGLSFTQLVSELIELALEN